MKPLKTYMNEGGLQSNEPMTNKQLRQNIRAERKDAREKRLIDKFADGDLDRLMMALEGDEEYMDFKERRKILSQLARMGGLAALTQIIPAFKEYNILAPGGTHRDRYEYFAGLRRPPGGG